MSRKDYPCDSKDHITGLAYCPYQDEFGNTTGNCRDNCGLGVDEDEGPTAEEMEEECMTVEEKCADATTKDAMFPSYTDVGGYALVYIIVGQPFCPECASREVNAGGVATSTILWEGPDAECHQCGKVLPTEYGNPWAEEEEEGAVMDDASLDAATGDYQLWVEFLGERFNCHPCSVTGNMPCDSGKVCDDCRGEQVHKEFLVWLANRK